MWETSIVMAIDSGLVKNLDLYRGSRELRRYGVVGDPLKASPAQGLRLIEAIVSFIEDSIKGGEHNGCYYNWLG